MPSMSQPASTDVAQGFSVYQPALGAPLQFLPAVGTKELDQLIDAYIPGHASAPEKRASISMDFFEYSGRTGQDFKYYAVYTPIATPESALSSSFNGSPVASDLSFYSSPSQASTPAAAPAAKKARVVSRKSATKQERSDFSHLPGMKILTKDGQDVTNSVSRGCKSKEQRDHAHLMRILKACDACKKKKIRCDPSHKKRAASQLEYEPRSEAAKPVKKTKKIPPPSMAECTASKPSSMEGSFQMDDLSMDTDLSAPLDESWEQFLTFSEEPAAAAAPQDFYGAIPQDFDFFFGADNSFSPSASGSSVSPIQPVTPLCSGVVPQLDDFTLSNHSDSLAFFQSEESSQELALPYLNPGGQHGSNYVDFNLFSPASSFVDEEPQLLKSGNKRSIPAPQTQRPDGLNAPLAGQPEWYFDQTQSTFSRSERDLPVPSGQGSSVGHGELKLASGSLPYHASDSSHNSQSVTGLQRVQSTCTNSSAATAHPCGEDLLGDVGLSRPSAAAAAATTAASPLRLLSGSSEGSGNAHVSSQTVSPTELQALQPRRRRRSLSRVETERSVSMVSTAVVPSGSPDPLDTPAARPHGPNSTLRAGSPSHAALSRGHVRTELSFCSELLPTRQQCGASSNVNAALPVHGLGLGQELIHPAASTPLRLLEITLAGGALSTLPVRQLLTSPSALFWLVAFGLVSLLMVVATSTLPTQAQTQTSILVHNIPIAPIILLSLLSVVSAHQRLRAQTSGGALDRIRSMLSCTPSVCRQAGLAQASLASRVSLLSCI